jgi:hypothetical protein
LPRPYHQQSALPAASGSERLCRMSPGRIRPSALGRRVPDQLPRLPLSDDLVRSQLRSHSTLKRLRSARCPRSRLLHGLP